MRCDGVHPNCTRCLSTGVLCAYPSSRRSRTTQPTNVDPFIDNLSHLEARIRRIESDLENQRSMMNSIVSPTLSTFPSSTDSGDAADSAAAATAAATVGELGTKMLKTEIEVQDSRSILAQLRLRGEQRISRGKRAAVAAAAQQAQQQQARGKTPTVSSSMSLPSKNKKEEVANEKTTTTSKNHGHSKQQMYHQSNTKFSLSNYKKAAASNYQKQQQLHRSSSNASDKTVTPSSIAMVSNNDSQDMYTPTTNSSFCFQGMMLDNHTDLSSSYETTNNAADVPPGHGMDWTLFDPQQQQQDSHFFSSTTIATYGSHLIFPADGDKMMMDLSPVSTRSSSLASTASSSSFMGYPPPAPPSLLQPSHSTASTTSNATSCSSLTSCGGPGDNVFAGFTMVDDMMLQQQQQQSLDSSQGMLYYKSFVCVRKRN